jgi:hypothetical protein
MSDPPVPWTWRLTLLVGLAAAAAVAFLYVLGVAIGTLFGQEAPVAHYRLDSTFSLPDTLVTPGVVETSDTAVICHRKTGTVREVTLGMHKTIFEEYGVPYRVHAAYEDDHVIPLELGGANSNANRWPQPLAQARIKDVVENYAHRQVCAGKLDLTWVQAWIARDWVVLLRYKQAHP